MPAKAYRYYVVHEFPEIAMRQTLKTQHQGALLPTLADDEPRTEMTAVGFADFPDYRKYHVMHETLQEVKGRYRNEPIRAYVAQVEFYIYYKPDLGIAFVDSASTICREMFKRAQMSRIPLRVDTADIDLVRLAQDLKERISGGWFGSLRIADVSTIGLFGATVGESAEWQRLEQLGTLSCIDLRYEYASQLYAMKITSDRTIVLFAPFTEYDALNFLEELQLFLDQYSAQINNNV